jgi:hypothetical protein
MQIPIRLHDVAIQNILILNILYVPSTFVYLSRTALAHIHALNVSAEHSLYQKIKKAVVLSLSLSLWCKE